jgi:hypothetical protein
MSPRRQSVTKRGGWADEDEPLVFLALFAPLREQ